MSRESYKLLIVDDSPIMCKAIAGMFDDDENISVIGEAGDGYEALNAITQLNPDVVTLDVNMPGMDGLATIKRLMIQSPRPTVMLSSLTREGSQITFDALRYGAVDFVTKPSQEGTQELHTQIDDIRAKVRFAAAIELEAIKYIRAQEMDSAREPGHCPAQHIVAMGAHEGGYGTFLKIIPQLQAEHAAAYLVVIYASHKHIDAFVEYLNIYSQVIVKRANHGQVVEAGVCYISSGDDYMTLRREDGVPTLHIRPAPFSSRKGSVDMLLFSVADTAADDALGIVLSGSSDDGAEGLEEVIRVGGTAIVQDPRTCMCKGMAIAAIQRSQIDRVVADTQIASAIHDEMQRNTSGGDAAVTAQAAGM